MHIKAIFAVSLLCLAACGPQRPKEDQSFKTIPRPADQAPGKASIRGTVTFRGKPAEGVPVLLCGTFNGISLGGFKCDPKYGSTVTDESGGYTFTDLDGNDLVAGAEYKSYVPVAVSETNPPAYEFWQKSDSMMADAIAPKPDEAYEVKPLDLKTKAIRLLSPAKDEKIKDRRPAFVFDEYPDAVRYEVKLVQYYVSPKNIVFEFEKPGSKPNIDLPVGTYRWTVTAYDSKSGKLSQNAGDGVMFSIVK